MQVIDHHTLNVFKCGKTFFELLFQTKRAHKVLKGFFLKCFFSFVENVFIVFYNPAFTFAMIEIYIFVLPIIFVFFFFFLAKPFFFFLELKKVTTTWNGVGRQIIGPATQGRKVDQAEFQMVFVEIWKDNRVFRLFLRTST